MTYTIRLTPPELRQKASQVDQNATVVQKELEEIERIINQLRKTFLGETASAFFREFDSLTESTIQWDDIVRSFAIEIREASNKLEAADRAHH